MIPSPALPEPLRSNDGVLRAVAQGGTRAQHPEPDSGSQAGVTDHPGLHLLSGMSLLDHVLIAVLAMLANGVLRGHYIGFEWPTALLPGAGGPVRPANAGRRDREEPTGVPVTHMPPPSPPPTHTHTKTQTRLVC